MDFRTLKANEIDCRVAQIDKNWCTLLLYKDARVDMNVLDETVGCMNWKKSYLRDNANCVVSIWNDNIKEWVSKEDTGTESFSEAEKGLASDSFKRACFNWGIGRELYTAPSIFIIPSKEMGTKEKGEFYENGTDNKGNIRYATKTRFWVEYIGYDDDRNIVDLIIRDNKNHIRFSQLTKETEKKITNNLQKMKKLIEQQEEKNEKFSREKFYEYYKATSDSTMLLTQIVDAIDRLEMK